LPFFPPSIEDLGFIGFFFFQSIPFLPPFHSRFLSPAPLFEQAQAATGSPLSFPREPAYETRFLLFWEKRVPPPFSLDNFFDYVEVLAISGSFPLWRAEGCQSRLRDFLYSMLTHSFLFSIAAQAFPLLDTLLLAARDC